MLALVAYSLKPVKLLAPAQRSATMLRPFAWNPNNVGLVKMSAHAPCNNFFQKKQTRPNNRSAFSELL